MPITVGALTNVPAPNDPIRSPWAQQLSGYAIHPFASAAALTANWGSAPTGSFAVLLDTGLLYERRTGVWQPVQGQVIEAAHATAVEQPYTSTGLRDILIVTPAATALAYPVRVYVNGIVWHGFGGSPAAITPDLFRMQGSVFVTQSPGPVQAPAANFVGTPLVGVWAVPAAGSTQFKVRANLTTVSGTAYIGAHASYQILTI